MCESSGSSFYRRCRRRVSRVAKVRGRIAMFIPARKRARLSLWSDGSVGGCAMLPVLGLLVAARDQNERGSEPRARVTVRVVATVVHPRSDSSHLRVRSLHSSGILMILAVRSILVLSRCA